MPALTSGASRSGANGGGLDPAAAVDAAGNPVNGDAASGG
ncbi:MAG: hypothetical protein JWQ99_1590, partial [Blastococcus sp.]|nr:hypothetical protein [Blastococcus sp.]